MRQTVYYYIYSWNIEHMRKQFLSGISSLNVFAPCDLTEEE